MAQLLANKDTFGAASFEAYNMNAGQLVWNGFTNVSAAITAGGVEVRGAV